MGTPNFGVQIGVRIGKGECLIVGVRVGMGVEFELRGIWDRIRARVSIRVWVQMGRARFRNIGVAVVWG